jgi:hypothetical protein
VELAWWFVTRSSRIKSGATTHKKSKVLPCRVKIKDLTLIGCVTQWPYWRH